MKIQPTSPFTYLASTAFALGSKAVSAAYPTIAGYAFQKILDYPSPSLEGLTSLGNREGEQATTKEDHQSGYMSLMWCAIALYYLTSLLHSLYNKFFNTSAGNAGSSSASTTAEINPSIQQSPVANIQSNPVITVQFISSTASASSFSPPPFPSNPIQVRYTPQPGEKNEVSPVPTHSPKEKEERSSLFSSDTPLSLGLGHSGTQSQELMGPTPSNGILFNSTDSTLKRPRNEETAESSSTTKRRRLPNRLFIEANVKNGATAFEYDAIIRLGYVLDLSTYTTLQTIKLNVFRGVLIPPPSILKFECQHVGTHTVIDFSNCTHIESITIHNRGQLESPSAKIILPSNREGKIKNNLKAVGIVEEYKKVEKIHQVVINPSSPLSFVNIAPNNNSPIYTHEKVDEGSAVDLGSYTHITTMNVTGGVWGTILLPPELEHFTCGHIGSHTTIDFRQCRKLKKVTIKEMGTQKDPTAKLWLPPCNVTLAIPPSLKWECASS